MMINGLESFEEHFREFKDQYVLIGGTACYLIMEERELPFRSTKDIDMVLIVESLTAKFFQHFWEYIKKAGYEHINKSTGGQQFYRFTSPKSKDYPLIIEIFSRNPSYITVSDEANITPLPIGEDVSSLSAILLNKEYYDFLKNGRIFINDIPILDSVCLIPFKAKAWLDLKSRKENGEHVDSKNIKKHKNDVFRLSQLITPNTRKIVKGEIAEDLKAFFMCMENEDIDLKLLGINSIDKNAIIQMLKRCYGID